MRAYAREGDETMRKTISMCICAVLLAGMLAGTSGCGLVWVPPVGQEFSDSGESSRQEEVSSKREESAGVPEKEEGSSYESGNSSALREDSFDYSRYVGEWVPVSRIGAQDVSYRGGSILTIKSVQNGNVHFSLKSVSAAPSGNAAQVEGNCAFYNGKGIYSFEDDGWGNAGTLQIEFSEDGSILVEARSAGSESESGVLGASGIYYSTGAQASYAGTPENQQAVVVETEGSSAMVSLRLWKDGAWDSVMSVSGMVGKSGITLSPSETTAATPEGVFRLGFAFGLEKPDTKLDFRTVTKDTYWVDDSGSKYYNMWRESASGKDWSSAEPLYSQFTKGNMRHCIVMEFNGNGLTSDGVEAGGGSVIFFCGRSGDLTSTNGDIYIADADMVKMLSYLDKDKNPVIAVWPRGE